MIGNIFKVLIVDDSNFFRLTARKMIENNFKVKIHEASNAFEAMRILGNNPIDIILLDVNMPEVDGFKAAKIIKHQENFSNIPIIFCTAMPPTTDVVQKSFDVGGIDFLNKPFTESEIVRILALYFRFIVREREINSKLKENQISLQQRIEEKNIIAKALLESEEKFRKISSSAYDAIIMTNSSNQITYWNQAAFRIFSYTWEDVQNLDLIMLISPPGKFQLYKITFDNLKKSAKDMFKSKHFELTGVRKGGEQIDLELSLSSVDINDNESFILVARDITIRKQAAILLERNEAMLADAEATAHIGSWEFVVATETTYWSKELYNIFGLGEQIIEPSIDLIKSMMNPNDAELFQQTIDTSMSSANPYVVETTVNSADGKTKFLEGRGRPIFDSNGSVTRMVGTLIDITEKKFAQQKMEEYLAELKESNATKDKFFSIIAHDLRNPFGALKNLSEIMCDMYDDFSEEERIELITEMKSSSQKLFNLLENLLTWSRSQRGIIQFYPDDVYLYQLARNCIDLLSDNAKVKQISLVNEIDEDLVLSCDNNMITTVLRNLISNAIKFTQEEGIIRVYSDIVDDEHVITIEDNGVGMTEVDTAKLFRIDVSHTTIGTGEEKGTGLGLILCKEFVEKHKGKIWVESVIGEGSKFRFTLPMTKS